MVDTSHFRTTSSQMLEPDAYSPQSNSEEVPVFSVPAPVAGALIVNAASAPEGLDSRVLNSLLPETRIGDHPRTSVLQ
ncbi:hypothetical protein [Pseudochelatococcus sp. G4_1912]|uniref:hypothetical protein n=1 Tax=Pseudochelatococcus sp. G4_1912 TaxID=3114288 RepID=UPI0039C5F5A0